MKNTYFYIILALVGVIIYLILTQPETPVPHVDEHQKEIEEKTEQIDSLFSAQSTILQKMAKDSLEYSEALERKEKAIKRLEIKLASVNLKTANVAKLDSLVLEIHPSYNDTLYCMPIASAREFMEDGIMVPILEEIIQNQGSKIELLKQEKKDNWESFNKLLTLEQEKTQLESERLDHENQVTEVYKSENKKLKRKLKFVKILVPVAFVAALFIPK